MPGIEISQVLRDRMAARHLTIRGVVNASRAYNQRDPETYAELKKAHLWSVLQPGYITARKPSAATLNTLIMVLWDGDWRAFDRATNFQAAHTLRADNDDLATITVEVEHYLEGEAPMRQRQRRGVPTCKHTDFLFTMRSDAMAPAIPNGATVECDRLDRDALLSDAYQGRCIILQDERDMLFTAWHVSGRTLERNHVPVLLKDTDTVYGVVTWASPRLDRIATTTDHALSSS